MKKIAIIGIGGRTGAMFAKELRSNNSVLGVGMEKEVEEIRKGNLSLRLNQKHIETFEAEMIKDDQFKESPIPDAIFLCTKNPVTAAVKYYYEIMKEKGGEMPILFLSQNGVAVIDEAREALEEVFGDDAKKIKVARISLFNSVSREVINGKVCLSYTLPIRLCFGPVSGSFEKGELGEFFDKTGIEAGEVSLSDVRSMELSKLFLNLIGMASASYRLSVPKGFEDSKVFKEEVEMLREYIKIVHAEGAHFIDFPHYPTKLMASLFSSVPISILSVFRKQIGNAIGKGRRGKAKDLDEISYYNGAVVELGKKSGIPTPVNQEIIKRTGVN